MSCKCTGHYENENFRKKYETFFPSDFIRGAGLYDWKLEMFIITQPHPHPPQDLDDNRLVIHPYNAETQPKINNNKEKNI